MWQKLHQELAGRNFEILAVAFDEADAAKPWIDAASPSYPCLIDRNHHVAELYHMVNVPQATWIDENGRIVRPAESAGQSDAFRKMDRTTGQMSADLVAARERLKSSYIDAVRDWVTNGPSARNALDATEARARQRLPDSNAALAHAHFRLAQHLKQEGNETEARRHFDEASRLHPDSWNIFRQSAAKAPSGLAAGPEFWARVDALGDRPYHLPVDIK